MSKRAADTRPSSAGIVEDKRPLVLFLFGLALLLADFLSLFPQPQEHSGDMAVRTDTGGWRIVRSTFDAAGTAEQGTQDRPLFAPEAEGSLPSSLYLFAGRPLPVNTADTAALTMLPGVGPALAEEIRREIRERGPLQGPEDLLKVRGIGPRKLEALLPLICF